MIYVKRAGVPVAPGWAQEEAQSWASQYGRTADVVWVPGMNCWDVQLSLRSSDPMLGAFNSGRTSEAPVEHVYLMEPNPFYGQTVNGKKQINRYISILLEQMGPSGLREFLEKGDTWSGRGEFNGLMDAVNRNRAAASAAKDKLRDSNRNDAIDMGREVRRQVLGIPLIPVGVEIPKESNETQKN
jgi:hypothetical protein